MQQFFDTKKEYEDYILLFRSGDFYEMFFDDAIRASKALDITLTKRGRHNGLDIPMCGIPHHALETYLQRLIKKGILAAVCDQVEAPEIAKKNRRVIKREITRIVTPGTLSEENLLEAREYNYICSVSKDENEKLGIAWLDMSTGDFFYCKSTVKTIQNELSNFNPSEILISSQLKNEENVKKVIKEYHVTEREEVRNPEMEISKYFESSFDMTRGEIQSCSTLLTYINETQKGKMPNLSVPKKFTTETILHIDPSTKKSLELTKTLSGEKSGTLLSILDRTVTPQGGRLLLDRLNCPSVDVDEINNRLNCVDYFRKMYPSFIDDIRIILKRCHDIERSLQRLSLRRGSPRDLSSIQKTLEEVDELKRFLNECEDTNFPILLKDAISSMTDDLNELKSELKKALQENLPYLSSDGDFIKKGYSPNLDEWTNIKENSKKIILNLQKNYIKDTGINSLKIDNRGVIGYYIMVPISQQNRMLEFQKDFIHCQLTKNHVRYKTIELTEIQDKINRADVEAKKIELNLFEELIQKVLFFADKLTLCAKSIANIDLYSSLALLALEKNYKRANVTNSIEFQIEGGRHPVVEHFQSKLGMQFTHNNCDMNDKNLLLITGANMGGKSTFLRQNALIVIMTQMGSFVPVEKANIGVVDKIFSRVGASDNLANDLSTFMIEMIETANILNKATKRSFVIMDEIGRGTSNSDGLAIAQSVLEYMNEFIKCRTLFATHYHELSKLKNTIESLKSFTLEVKETNDKIIFTYKVIPGDANKSYGIHVAQIAGIPTNVILKAQKILEEFEKMN
eukprot:gene1849-990_t